MRKIAVLIALSLSVALAPASSATGPVQLAEAAFTFPTSGGGYIVWFTVMRNFAPTVSTLQMTTDLDYCVNATGNCTLVGQQIDTLPGDQFGMHKDQSATLRTVWAGRPLWITWTRKPGYWDGPPGSAKVWTYLQTNHSETMIQPTVVNTNARLMTFLGGHLRCSDPISFAASSQSGAANEDLLLTGGTPRADSVSGFVHTKGRCGG